MAESVIRHRRHTQPPTNSPSPPPNKEEVVWGKTPSGQVFRVPTTHDVLTALFHPSYPKSHFDIANLALLALQLVLFVFLPRKHAQIFFFCYFLFWRAAYDAGLGWVLTKQSKRRWIVREVQRRGWLDAERRPVVREWIRKQLVGKMGKDYSFDELPVEYNSWLLFRQVVDIILINDFLSYCMFAFACFRVPNGLSTFTHVMRWLAGIAMIGFNLWVKTEAHDVVKDYGWYWGDVFFQRGALVFDGVFEFAPHPMYSVGYAGYYGLSLIVGSYPVLFVSLIGHAAQFGFLQFFENPHIERTYGQRKLLAQRIPLMPRSRKSKSDSEETDAPRGRSQSISDPAELSTPANTEGESATETDLETETESETTPPSRGLPLPLTPRGSIIGLNGTRKQRTPSPAPMSQHDLMNTYFRKDALLFSNIDLFRTGDLKLVLLVVYALLLVLLPSAPSARTVLTLHFVHALAWALFHAFGLGLLLQGQSRNKMLVRHFLANYHYPAAKGRGRGQGEGVGKAAAKEAFENWKGLYDLSLCMMYVSFLGLVWKAYSIPKDWTVGTELLRHTLGLALIGLHVWATTESLEVLGVFGWFYGDFFMEDFPASLEYTGIYRYLNNPDVMNGAGFLGLAFISGNKLVFAVTVVRHLSQWWFLRYVENPHMRKLYGSTLRKEAGFVKVFKKVASKNAQRVPEIRRVAKEVRGTFEKVYEETADVVEDFLNKSRPRISEVMQETKVLLQQSRERLVITRVATDLTAYDTAKYRVSVQQDGRRGVNGELRFHLGEAIMLNWMAPAGHSRKDWVGIYRIGANQSKLVTRTSSLGTWMPVHDDEWDGDIPLDVEHEKPAKDSDSGQIVFAGESLPWKVGKYEIRYHHDGKYNVMAIEGPIEIYVDKPDTMDFAAIRTCLKRIVPLCLDSDPSLIPLSCLPPGERGDGGRDPDDFRFWSERQAKRISMVVEQSFGVEYATEVVVADANLTALANRILVSKEILDS